MTELYVISFPRSGHHLLVDCLHSCCKYYKIDFSYCEFYNCCKLIPCKKGKRIQKNHDFNINGVKSFKKTADKKYIILYRKNKIEQLEAFYRYEINKKHGKYNNLSSEDPSKYNILKCAIFCMKESDYYDSFIKKWVDHKFDKNYIVIDYNEFLKDYPSYILRILKVLESNKDCDIQEIISILREINIVKKKTLIKNKIYLLNLLKFSIFLYRFANILGFKLGFKKTTYRKLKKIFKVM